MWNEKTKISRRAFCFNLYGSFIPIGLIFGMLIGTGFMGAGIAIGLVIGFAIGISVENEYKKKGMIRPLTKEEKRKKKIAMIIGLSVAVLFALIVLGFFLFR